MQRSSRRRTASASWSDPNEAGQGGVAGHSGYRGDPWGRLARTSTFLGYTTFATAELAECITSYRPELEVTPAVLDTARFLLREPPLPWTARSASPEGARR